MKCAYCNREIKGKRPVRIEAICNPCYSRRIKRKRKNNYTIAVALLEQWFIDSVLLHPKVIPMPDVSRLFATNKAGKQ